MHEGAHKSLRGAPKERIADFVHGTDGFGNTRPPLAEVRAAHHLQPRQDACQTAHAACLLADASSPPDRRLLLPN